MSEVVAAFPALAAAVILWAAHRLITQMDDIAERMRQVELTLAGINGRLQNSRLADRVRDGS